MKIRNNKKVFKYARTIFFIVFFVWALDLFFPLPKPKEFSKVVLSENGTLLKAYLTSDDKWRLESHIDSVSSNLIKLLLYKEDKYFYYHFGVNPFAIIRAAIGNITGKGKISGASTITMQVARILEPRKRNLFNKFIEALRAVQLELHYSKKEILNLYLSYAPYGGNIEGITSAAFIYFNKPPSQLSLAQAAELVVIPQNPNKYRPDKFPGKTKGKRNALLKKLFRDKIFSKTDIELALQEPVTGFRFSIPKLAQHFCDFIAQKNKSTTLKTTLSLTKQYIAEQLLEQYIAKIQSENISNGAILIVDNKTNNIKAYVGSVDFDNIEISGQVNGVIATRSPGSTLKPFLYAQLFDKGFLTPQQKIPDIPINFGGYEPENFNLKFHGLVTAKYALANSLNIPAVVLLKKNSLKNFLELLTNLGFNYIAKTKDKLGLSVILGGCGANLRDLVQAYTVFPNKGNLYGLRYLQTDERLQKKKIFSEEACYMISDILSSNERPDLQVNFFPDSKLPNVAWKTGTSYGKRDAWAIGYSVNYTIGVWLGNFDGKGSPFLTGAEKAVPLLIELFNAIDYNSNKKWFDFPQHLNERPVCVESGLLPTENCKNTKFDFYIQNVTGNKKCNVHKKFFVNKNESVSYCTECLSNHDYHKKIYSVYSPEISYWYENNGIQFDKPPKHNPECIANFTGRGPKILSPQNDFEYYLNKKNHEKILLQAVTDEKAKTLYWFINGDLVNVVRSGTKLFYQPESDSLDILCVDDTGRKSKLKIEIKYY